MAQDSLRHVEVPPSPVELAELLKTSGRNLTCAVCGRPLFRGERKVHRRACAHKRDLQLQKLRRRSGRS